jgi:hypothetical protein
MAGAVDRRGPPLDDDVLLDHLLDAGRRTVGLRAPRRLL